jgi:hypothetical protein
MLGLTEEQIADHFAIDYVTFCRWKNEIPSFFKALVEGKLPADANTARSLYQRANGYDHEAVKIFLGKDGKPIILHYIEHHPPDVGAIKTWLFNRRPDLWKETSRQIDMRAKIEVEVQAMSPEQRYARLTELLVKAGVLELEPEPTEGEYEELEPGVPEEPLHGPDSGGI